MIYHIFVINLKRCVKKKEKMKLRLRGMNFSVVEGVDGRNLNIEKIKNKNNMILKEWKDPWSGRNITWGEVGCTLSHCSIYEKCLNENIETAVILEDDVLLKDNFKVKLEETIKEIEKYNNWDLCYLGRKSMDNNDVSVNDLITDF